MTWALWLAAPVGATGCAAVASWWHGRRAVRRRRPNTVEAMQEHRDYLDSLQAAPRGTHRVGS
jgi:hypothetical protein